MFYTSLKRINLTQNYTKIPTHTNTNEIKRNLYAVFLQSHKTNNKGYLFSRYHNKPQQACQLHCTTPEKSTNREFHIAIYMYISNTSTQENRKKKTNLSKI